MKKEDKNDLKQDEVRSFLEHGLEWAARHRDQLRIAGLVIIVVAAGVGALSYFQANRAEEAAIAFEEAMIAWSAPVAAKGDVDAEKPAGVSFETAEAKYKEALQKFDGVARRFGSTREGRRASYYAALCQVELGQYPEAEKTLHSLSGERSGLESDLALVALAGLHRKTGQSDKAIEIFRQIATDPTPRIPRDAALAGLAGSFEDARRFEDARASYEQLAEEHPTSPYATEARRRVEYLATAGKS